MIESAPTAAADVLAHTTTLRVRYPECDPMGFAHHSSYVVWFECARVELLRCWGLTHAELEAAGAPMVVARLTLEYKRPARYDETLSITARLARVTPARIEIEHTVRRQAEVLCTGRATICCLREDGRPKRFPPELRVILDNVPLEAGSG